MNKANTPAVCLRTLAASGPPGTTTFDAVARAIGTLLLLLLLGTSLEAASISLEWDANAESDLAGYIMFYGTTSGVYTSQVTVGNQTTWTATGLTAGQHYYFALKAYNHDQLQSSFSAEVHGVAPTGVTPSVLNLNNVNVTEGASGTALATFTATLSPASTQTVTVNYTTVNGTATSGSDYVAANGILTFAPGVSTRPIGVTLKGDTTVEPNETFNVTLSGAVNAVLGTASGTGTIMNDDAPPPPTVTASPTTATPGSVVAATVANAPGYPRDWAGLYPIGAPDTGYVAWQYLNGSDTPPATGVTSATMQFTAPTTPGSYDVRIYADDLMGVPAATSNSINVQTLPALTVNSVSVTEGHSGTTPAAFTVTLSRVSTQTVTVNYTTANGTATGGSDYVAASGVLTFAPGVSTRPISVTINGDTTVEANETFSVTLSSAANAVLGTASGTGTITNDDTAPILSSLAIGNASLPEGHSGTTPAAFTVTLSPVSTQTVTVNYTTVNGTATAGSDYVAATGVLTFAPGVSTRPISVSVNGDTTVEANETFSITLSVPLNAVLGTASGTGTITNDDTAPILSSLAIGNASLPEGHSGTTPAAFTVTLSPVSTQTVTVNYTTVNGTATAGSDYVAASGILTFAPGVSTRPISVSVNGDTTVEANETFSITLSVPLNAVLGTASGIGTITNDDTAPILSSLAIGNASLPEGHSGTTTAAFTATLSPVSAQTVTVNYTTVNGTATAGSDYVAASGVLTFAPGVSTRPISVSVNGDTTVEANETFSITLSSAANAVLGTASGTGTITNDDAPPATTVTASPATVDPGSVITATVANGPGNPRDWAGLYPTGASNADYVAWQYFNGSEIPPATAIGGATLLFAAPTVPGSYNVRIFANDLMSIAAAMSNTINVQALPALSVNSVSVTEGHSGTTAATLTVALSPVSTKTVTVNYASANGTATAGSDYVATSGVLTFAPGISTRPISVSVNGDTSVEPTETFSITLSNATNAVLGTASGTGSITNDDTALAPTVTVSATSVNPGSVLTVTVANGTGYANDWIGLFATGAPDSTYLAWQFLNGATTPPATGVTSATLQVIAPTAAGTYNIRLFANVGKSIKVATSATITVVAATPASVTVSPTTVNPSGAITVTVANGAGYAGDWIGLFTTGAPDSHLSRVAVPQRDDHAASDG